MKKTTIKEGCLYKITSQFGLFLNNEHAMAVRQGDKVVVLTIDKQFDIVTMFYLNENSVGHIFVPEIRDELKSHWICSKLELIC